MSALQQPGRARGSVVPFCWAHLFEKQVTLSGTTSVSVHILNTTRDAVLEYTAPTATAFEAQAGIITLVLSPLLPAAVTVMMPKL